MDYDSPQAVQTEIMKLLPGYYNLGEPRPVTARPERYLADGYVREVAARYAVAGEAPSDSRPFALIMGQVLYHSGKLSTRALGLLKLYPSKGRLHMNPADRARLQVNDHDIVRLTSALGTVELRTEADHDQAPGSCFLPEHFNEPPVKDLFECVTDPVTGVPAFKFTRVRIEKVA
jgi:formate dehydrogenase alpha subunit